MALTLTEVPQREKPALLSMTEFAPPQRAEDRPNGVGVGASADGADPWLRALDGLELEALMLNFDTALRVHSRPHFFNWTQGVLQSLIRHEVLVCALRGSSSSPLQADCFSTLGSGPTAFSDAFLRDASIAPGLIKTWEERGYRPVLCEVGGNATGGGLASAPIASGPFVRELERVKATHILAHGMLDPQGGLSSLYLFACAPGAVGPRQAYLAQLAVPVLHSAYVRALVQGRQQGQAGATPPVGSRITEREREILKWIYLGKSNIEIGVILRISPLTVKNHVQKILRKLDVLNRTQAVGKALALRILNT